MNVEPHQRVSRPRGEMGREPVTRAMVALVARPLLLVLLFAGGARAQQQGPGVDPLLSLRPRLPTMGGRAARVLGPGALPGLRAPLPEPAAADRLSVLVQVDGPDALLALRRLGAEIGVVAGDIATARVPAAALDALGAVPALRRVEAARLAVPFHDVSLAAVRGDEVRRRAAGEWLGATGRGVVTGIYDTGIDLLHGDFRDEGGASRVLAVWDQATGERCDSVRIAMLACSQRDDNGHGTHVAGTAAGDGSATGPGGTAFQFAGAAPLASIVAVRGSFLTSDIVEGVSWIFEQAAAAGRPAVVNLSLGGQFGPHDGTSLFERALDNLSGPGRIIVVSAGNDGAAGNTEGPRAIRLVHGQAVVTPGRPGRLTVTIPDYTPNPGRCDDNAVAELWYAGGLSLDITVRRPDGTVVSGGTGRDADDPSPAGGVQLVAPAARQPNGDRTAILRISDCAESGPPQAGEWTLSLESEGGGGAVHLWLQDLDSRLGSRLPAGGAGFDNTHVVSTPATARDVIAVGAFVTRLCWPVANGERCWDDLSTFAERVGDIAHFSGGGPTRDGRLKPEITAPGRLVVSSRSRDASIPETLAHPDGRHWTLQGTSMAAPHVTGTVALLLQLDPALGPAEVRDILTRAATTDPFTRIDYTAVRDGVAAGTPNNQWGHGKLDIRAALERLADPGTAVAVSISPPSDTIPLGATLQLEGALVDAFGDPLPVSLRWRSTDPTVATVSGTGLLTPLREGRATVIAEAGGLGDSTFIEVVQPATLVVRAEPVQQADLASSRMDTTVPLLELMLAVDGFEAIRVERLGLRLAGEDPGARLILAADEDGDGVVDAADPVVEDTLLPLRDGEAVQLLLAPDSLVVAARDTAHILVGLRMSGAAPNGARFSAVFLPDSTRSAGVRSGAERREGADTPVASAPTRTTVLQPDELFALSENPVRSDAGRLVFNFADMPEVAAIFTLEGRRVVDLRPLVENGRRVEWRLRNDRGAAVAPGIYLLVVRVGGTWIRERLIIARTAAGG